MSNSGLLLVWLLLQIDQPDECSQMGDWIMKLFTLNLSFSYEDFELLSILSLFFWVGSSDQKLMEDLQKLKMIVCTLDWSGSYWLDSVTAVKDSVTFTIFCRIFFHIKEKKFPMQILLVFTQICPQMLLTWPHFNSPLVVKIVCI